MKNIQVIDGADNCVYDIFATMDEEFYLIFRARQDIAFIDEVMTRGPEDSLDAALSRIWQRRVRKSEAMGIHGLLFYELEYKKKYYATRCDEEAENPDGSNTRRRWCGALLHPSECGLVRPQ